LEGGFQLKGRLGFGVQIGARLRLMTAIEKTGCANGGCKEGSGKGMSWTGSLGLQLRGLFPLLRDRLNLGFGGSAGWAYWAACLDYQQYASGPCQTAQGPDLGADLRLLLHTAPVWLSLGVEQQVQYLDTLGLVLVTGVALGVFY
ncbi:MAG: hypothetical protein QM765_10835, partial [Myxococcales bacterium]